VKRFSQVVPGYDCIRYPCGRNGRRKPAGASHGVHCDEYQYTVSDGRLALSIVVYSGKYPSSVPPDNRLDHLFPNGAGLRLHVGYPNVESDGENDCEYVNGGKCYCNSIVSFTKSDEFVRSHFRAESGFNQPESFWNALEDEFVLWSRNAPSELQKVEAKT
jgi:hypothetical protein